MSISSISSSQIFLSSQTLQTNNTNQDPNEGNDTTQASGSPYRRHHADSTGLMQAVKQALSQMGLNLDSQSSSSQATNGTDSTSNSTTDTRQALHAFMHDLFGVLKGTQNQSNETSGNGNSQIDNASMMTTQIQQVIQAFDGSDTSSNDGSMGTLQADFSNLTSSLAGVGSSNGTQSSDLQVFLQNLLQDQISGTGSNGNSQVGSVQSGYPTDLSSQLQNVIQALGSGNSSSTQDSNLNKLQSDFQSLVNSLNGGTSNNGSNTPNLQDFLQNLIQNLPGPQAISPAIGSFFSTTA